MSYDVDVIRGSTVYSLSDGQPFWALTMTGLGLPPIRLIKERSPQQDGSTVVGQLLDERLLNLALLIDAPNEAIAAQYRRDLAKILKPIDNVPCTLRITENDGLIRQIDTYTVGTVDFPITPETRMAGKQSVIAQFEAPDPIPYDPALQNIVFTVASGSGPPGGFQIPLLVPAIYSGASSIDAIESLTYDGDWETFPVLYLTGPMIDPIITNETTGKVLNFTGSNISAGDTWTVDLRYRHKNVIDSLGALKNAALTDASDLVTWSLVPDPEAVDGVNDIRVDVPSGATADSKVRIEFFNRYPSLG